MVAVAFHLLVHLFQVEASVLMKLLGGSANRKGRERILLQDEPGFPSKHEFERG
jgi:hypothetical protein